MAACEAPAATVLPQALIWADDVYLVPRGRRLFIGATVEDANFDISVSRQARDHLLAAARRIVPSLEGWRLAEMWAGLRPRTPDDAPVLGAARAAGLFVAGGQFRNGILFAPAVADAICGLVLGQPGHVEYRAFDPRRFAVP
ncbi:MAG: glycine oxidase [Alphaproteobacteria bacterium]|jgi:glycine oxidase|nr:glycine oxidase [Alphaproteobacteria bacterium]